MPDVQDRDVIGVPPVQPAGLELVTVFVCWPNEHADHGE